MSTEPETSFLDDSRPEMTWEDFLQNAPPATPVKVLDAVERFDPTPDNAPRSVAWRVRDVDIERYCPRCQGLRLFRPISPDVSLASETATLEVFWVFDCKNCSASRFKIAFWVTKSSAYKYGESPAFGPPTPSSVIKLFGPDRDLYLKGRRAEFQGLGIGAFVYYRQLVENQNELSQRANCCITAMRIAIDLSLISEGKQ